MQRQNNQTPSAAAAAAAIVTTSSAAIAAAAAASPVVSSAVEVSDNTTSFPLESLPDDAKLHLYRFLNKTSAFNLARTSKHLCFLYQDAHTRYPALYANPFDVDSLRKLLSHAALGEWNAASAIWSNDPSLLTCRGTVYHPNPKEITPQMNPGRYKYVQRTAWQIALMNEEYELAEEIGRASCRERV